MGFGCSKGKMVILGDSREFLESLELLECVGAKDRALAKFGDFSRILVDLWSV
jgi:hypothetical protein